MMRVSDQTMDAVIVEIQLRFQKDYSGHDFPHSMRVYRRAMEICEAEGAGDLLIVGLGALLHDVADHKFGYTDLDRIAIIRDMLIPLNVADEIVQAVIYISNFISFKGGTNTHEMASIEGRIVQDADRLDALGAIGIARTFAYGGHAGRPIYTPVIGPNIGEGEDSIAHFYQKLLKLKDKMNTQKGREMAEIRHERLVNFLKDFYEEWDV